MSTGAMVVPSIPTACTEPLVRSRCKPGGSGNGTTGPSASVTALTPSCSAIFCPTSSRARFTAASSARNRLSCSADSLAAARSASGASDAGRTSASSSGCHRHASRLSLHTSTGRGPSDEAASSAVAPLPAITSTTSPSPPHVVTMSSCQPPMPGSDCKRAQRWTSALTRTRSPTLNSTCVCTSPSLLSSPAASAFADINRATSASVLGTCA
mmetsp:Transcript_45275/g.125620  ORF Transcript_45275/g.125620 Transcript_45275/m.125620 type:complete len:212 (-) Transcript_45275:1521-2156(-)